MTPKDSFGLDESCTRPIYTLSIRKLWLPVLSYNIFSVGIGYVTLRRAYLYWLFLVFRRYHDDGRITNPRDLMSGLAGTIHKKMREKTSGTYARFVLGQVFIKMYYPSLRDFSSLDRMNFFKGGF